MPFFCRRCAEGDEGDKGGDKGDGDGNGAGNAGAGRMKDGRGCGW